VMNAVKSCVFNIWVTPFDVQFIGYSSSIYIFVTKPG